VFRGLINDAKAAAGAVVARYAARASVAIPFVLAAGFALAAITLTLVERFGSIAAYWMVAGGCTAIGLVAALVVSIKEQEAEVADAEAEKADTAEVATDAAAQAAVQLPLALLGTLLTSPAGPTSAAGMLRLLGRNLPLVLLLVAIGFLMWPAGSADAQSEAALDDHPPPSPEHAASEFEREAA
jgi:hypothetical protein